MDVFEVMKQRRSIRGYSNEAVSDQQIRRLIEAAVLAPSAGNVQPWKFVVVKDSATKTKLAEAALGQSFVKTAPLVIVVCADTEKAKKSYGKRGEKLYSIQDTAAATQNILLTVQDLGLATCWVGAFNDKEVSKAINAPKNIRPVAVLPIGYAANPVKVPLKKSVDEVIHYERF